MSLLVQPNHYPGKMTEIALQVKDIVDGHLGWLKEIKVTRGIFN